MIGCSLKRKRDRQTFRVVGRNGGHWVLAPVEHGPAIEVSPLEASELFSVAGDAPEAAEVAPVEAAVFGRSAGEQASREALAAVHVADVVAQSSGAGRVRGLHPEEALKAGDLTAAEIVADPRWTWAYRAQRLAVSGSTAAEVDRLLAERGEA